MLKRKLLTLTLCGALAMSLGACTNRAGKGATDGNEGPKTNQVRPYGLNRTGTNNDMNLGTNQRLGGNGTIDERGVDRNRLNYNRWDNRRGNNITNMHNNTRMDMNRDLERQINKIKGVDNAYVVLTDNNAYVAVRLSGKAGRHNDGNRTLGDAGINRNNNNNGIVRGSTNNGLGMKGTTYNGRGTTVNVMGDDVDESIKRRIAVRIHSVRPDIDNIYISANPDFVGRMRGYADKVQQGKPISGLIMEFNNLADRVFPSRTNYDMGTTRIGR